MQFIYVVKRADLPVELPHTGIWHIAPSQIDFLFSRGFFIERTHAEEDPEFKQIIPYCVLLRGKEIFVFRRLQGGGEKRLYDLRSIGVGGHIEPTEYENGNAWKQIETTARRELEEEVEIMPECNIALQYCCILNDDSNPVGSVHLGVVYIFKLPDHTQIRVRETEVMEGNFETLEHIRQEPFEHFESWSRLLLESDYLTSHASDKIF